MVIQRSTSLFEKCHSQTKAGRFSSDLKQANKKTKKKYHTPSMNLFKVIQHSTKKSKAKKRTLWF